MPVLLVWLVPRIGDKSMYMEDNLRGLCTAAYETKPGNLLGK
jgi:hypothetical protein